MKAYQLQQTGRNNIKSTFYPCTVILNKGSTTSDALLALYYRQTFVYGQGNSFHGDARRHLTMVTVLVKKINPSRRPVYSYKIFFFCAGGEEEKCWEVANKKNIPTFWVIFLACWSQWNCEKPQTMFPVSVLRGILR